MIMMAVIALAMIADAPWVGEIREKLGQPVVAQFTSPKPIDRLELCVANVVTTLGTPVVLRDGPDKVVILASAADGRIYLTAVSMTQTNGTTHIDLRVQGKGWNDRIATRLQSCL